MERSFVIPSVFEENSTEFHKVAENFVDGIKIMDFNGKDYIIGNLALREGSAPHKLINTSVSAIDFQLMAIAGLVVSTMGRYSKLVVTAGFPFSTYQSYRKDAEKLMLSRFDINFDSRTFGGQKVDRAAFEVENVEIMTEVDGCVKAIRDGIQQEKNNFFIASLGYGTFEIAQSMLKGIVQRTTYSTKGLHYAVNLVENELRKDYYLNLLTEQQIERSFQRGLIILDRKKINLKELRQEALASYYNEVISPAIKRKFTDEDYLNADILYLVGGGAMYPELVDLFKEEFKGILDVEVYPEPYLCAARGYCLQSMSKAKFSSDIEKEENTAYVGLDIGNSNTVVYVSTPEIKSNSAE
jgi:actin-like ATPase involved in cell morphogenesis